MQTMNVVYTAHIGGYEQPQARFEHPLPEGWAALFFTDTPELAPPGWNVVEVNAKKFTQRPPHFLSRFIKIRPDVWIGEYDTCVWIDACDVVKGDLQELCDKNPGELLAWRHPNAPRSFFEELRQIAMLKRRYCGRHWKDKVKRQVAWYSREGVPGNAGTAVQTNVVIRRDGEWTRRVCKEWLNDLLEHETGRDQPSLRYVEHKHGFKVGVIPRAHLSAHNCRKRADDTYVHHHKHKAG